MQQYLLLPTYYYIRSIVCAKGKALPSCPHDPPSFIPIPTFWPDFHLILFHLICNHSKQDENL